MFLLSANGVSLKLERREILTSGAQNIYLCQFDFGPRWEGLDKTAVFQAQNVKISLVLDGENRCQIPYEVLQKPFVKLFVGVYGTKNGEIVMPTVMQDLGRIEKGVSLGEAAQEPTPGVYDQILANSNEALETARALKADADAGMFDGVDGMTPEIGENGNWFIGGVDTGKPSKGKDGFGAGDVGESGATFTPAVDAEGNLSWSNDRGLENPAAVNIRGPKGDRGEAGPEGIQGQPGADGARGETGPQGVPGERGEKGETGSQGEKGEKGDPGADGETPVIGENGNWYIGGVDTGKPSRGAPGVSTGEGGAGENGATFTPTVDAQGNLSWSNDKGLENPATVNIRGPKGDQGEPGVQGIPGEKGETGAQGPQGIPGEKGETGEKGEAGPQGEPGAKGETGPQGIPGEKGEAGPQGLPGEPGSNGVDGYSPVKGTDYWTEEDKAELVQQVLEALPDGDEVSY